MHSRLLIMYLALVTLCAPDSRSAAFAAKVTTTLYVGRHFEMRDHDQPVKYVFDQEKRLARVTGSLSNNPRLQRLRLRTGWNLVSLAVTAADFLGQIQPDDASEPLLRTAYRWQEFPQSYQSLEFGESVAAGSVLWLQARTNQVIAVRGEYNEPASPTIPAGGAFVSSIGLEAWPVKLPPEVSLWKFDAGRNSWQVALPGDLAPLGHAPSAVAPGEAIYIQSPSSFELAVPDPESRVAYYHPDHLDSAAVVTDSVGKVIAETAYHPFGAIRQQTDSGTIDPVYGFTQKERDRESRLHYFEARYMGGSLGRFLSYDPFVHQPQALEHSVLQELLRQPAKWNPYTYALNNPLHYNDPDGRDPRPRPIPSRRDQAKPERPKSSFQARTQSPAKLSKDIAAVAGKVISKHAAPKRKESNRDQLGISVSEIQVTRHEDVSSTCLFHVGLFKEKDEKNPGVASPWEPTTEGNNSAKNSSRRANALGSNSDSKKQDESGPDADGYFQLGPSHPTKSTKPSAN